MDNRVCRGKCTLGRRFRRLRRLPCSICRLAFRSQFFFESGELHVACFAVPISRSAF